MTETTNYMTTDMPAPPARPASFRWQAFGIHLAISLIILAALLYVLFYYWFPDYLFDTDGGWQALRVIVGVDIVLGPLLTLIAANPRKTFAVLRKDFMIIALIQASALSAGTWLAWDNRPYAVFWYDGAFHSLPYSAFKGNPQAKQWIADNSHQTPNLIFVDLPEDPEARYDIMRLTVQQRSSALFDAHLYRTWPGDSPRVDKHGAAILREINREPAIQQQYLNALTEQHLNPDSIIPVPVRSRYGSYFLLLSRLSHAPIDALQITPKEAWLTGLYSTRNLELLPADPLTDTSTNNGKSVP